MTKGGNYMKTYPVLDLQATGRQIKKLRVRKQLSVKDICDYMGFENPQAVYKWQRGESLPSVDNLFALSRLLEIPIDHILCEQHTIDRRCSQACDADFVFWNKTLSLEMLVIST